MSSRYASEFRVKNVDNNHIFVTLSKNLFEFFKTPEFHKSVVFLLLMLIVTYYAFQYII